MNMTLNKVAVLKLASVAFLALAIILVFVGMFSIQEPAPQQPKAAPTLYSVWAFDEPQNHGSMISADMFKQVTTTQLDQRYVLKKRLAVGRRLSKSVEKGDYLTDDLFATIRPMIDDLELNQRAVAIRADEVLTVGGYIQPGDHVDVMLLLKPNRESGTTTTARKIASNLKVLAVGDLQFGTESEDRENHAKSVVLSVYVDLAPTILLADSSGELRLAAVGSKELTNEKTNDFQPRSLLHTVSLRSQPSEGTKTTSVAELRQFLPPRKKVEKASKPKPTRQHAPQRVRYVELIQGDERSVVKVPQQ